MPDPTTSKSCNSTLVAELFHLQFSEAEMGDVMRSGEATHCFFTALEGYLGVDLLLLSETELFIIVRWENCLLFDTHLSAILHASPLSEWLKKANMVTHQPAILKTMTHTVQSENTSH